MQSMKIKIFGGLLIATFALTSIAEAQTRTPVVNQRQRNEQRRINQGIRNGELSKNETRHLLADEKDIRKDKRMAKADGHVTTAERRQLRRDENRTSRAIYRDKHNKRVRK
jgi:hypothetical protein